MKYVQQVRALARSVLIIDNVSKTTWTNSRSEMPFNIEMASMSANAGFQIAF